MVLTDEGKVYGFGDNSRGQIESICNEAMFDHVTHNYTQPRRVKCLDHLLLENAPSDVNGNNNILDLRTRRNLVKHIKIYADEHVSVLRIGSCR